MFRNDASQSQLFDPPRPQLGRGVISRRGVLRGLVGGTGVALLGRSVAAQETAPGVTTGDCSKLEGLQLLLDWRAGREVISPDDLLPDQTWQLFQATGIGVVFYYPGDWTASGIWASGLTRSGAIDWRTKPSPTSYLSGARITSPDEKAIYEFVSGTIPGVVLDLNDAALAAEQGALGEGKTTNPICVYEDAVSFTQNWTRAGSYDDRSVVTGGNLYSSADPYYSYSVLSYQTFIGPEPEFTSLMRTVYIPIMYQFLLGGGSISGSDDDGDDDDDDDTN